MRQGRSLTQPTDNTNNVKKHSSSSGSGEVAADSALCATTSSGVGGASSATRTSPSTSTTDRPAAETFHNIQNCRFAKTIKCLHARLKAASQFLCKPLRVMVSQNRRRYQGDGFDLDLTYITDRIIAMGYPADRSEAFYRNSMNETQAFLEKHHHDHYKVFNLRGRYVYDPSKFHHRVINFEMTDHHPPRLELMAPFCREVHEYLEQDPSNVVAVHCKAGKGRTGVMICAYLVYINFYPSPRQNMDYYSIVRTKNNKGVTIPSQRRYVYYFSHLRNHKLNYMPLRVELVGIFFERPPKMPKMSTKNGFSLVVANGDVNVFNGDVLWLNSDDWLEEERAWSGNVVSQGENSFDPYNPSKDKNIISRRAWGWQLPANKRVFLEGDVRINLFSETKLMGVKRDKAKVGHIWLNTMFACAGFCGGVYRHGDEAHPYPDGATTITEKKTQPHRPKAGSASLPNSPPVAEATRGSEPHIDRNAEESAAGGSSRKLDRRATRDKEPNRPNWDDDLELLLPPGLNKHCSPESLRLIYGNEKQPPRVSIEEMLRDAHKNNLMVDSYNHRRLSVPQEGSPVAPAAEGRPSASGPNLIRRVPDEHVQVFSVLEIDRACKNKDIDPNFKMFVVTRCVPPEVEEDQKRAESFLRVTHQKQAFLDKRLQDKLSRSSRRVPSASAMTDEAAGSSTASTAAFCADLLADPRRSDPFMAKFFRKQRHDSMSVYPGQLYRCPLISPLSGSTTSEVTFSAGERNPLLAHSRAPSSVTSGDWTEVDPPLGELSELDLEVRSYHPDIAPDHSGSSRSSSSSEEGLPENSTEIPMTSSSTDKKDESKL